MAAGKLALNITESEEEKRKARKKRKKNMGEIARINALARAERLSYGQYVGKYGL